MLASYHGRISGPWRPEAEVVAARCSGKLASMLASGDSAPDFELPDQDGETVTLSALRGQTVVVYFYPKADTPG